MGERTDPRVPMTAVVVEGPDAAMARALREVEVTGMPTRDGFGPDAAAPGTVRVGDVANVADAETALLAALRGERLLIHATAPRDVVDRLVDDLRRIGSVDHRVGTTTEEPRVPREARQILALLSEGSSLREAAARLGLSRRTADRRLAEARRALGTTRTTEAIARARQLGWLISTTEGDADR